jgi:hypothetical protein
MALTLATATSVGGNSPTPQPFRLYSGGLGDNDNDVIVQADDVSTFRDFYLSTTAGATDVIVSLDGTNYITAPISMEDLGSVSFATAVIVTAANRLYHFRGCFQKIRVMQNGATDAADVTLLCAR